MSSRYDVISPNTLQDIRRDAELSRLKDRIEKLEAAMTHIYAWYPISTFNPHQTIKEIKEFALKALEGKDD